MPARLFTSLSVTLHSGTRVLSILTQFGCVEHSQSFPVYIVQNDKTQTILLTNSDLISFHKGIGIAENYFYCNRGRERRKDKKLLYCQN